jgi:transposase-like protein
MDFPLIDYLDDHACYRALVRLLHPDGLACPRCGARTGLLVHRRHRDPVTDYRCRACRRVFNAFTATPLRRTRRSPAQLILILRGVAQGQTTAAMARELGVDRPRLLELRHRLQARALAACDRTPLADAQVEADEVYQNAGEKGRGHPDPGDPPRRRANQAAGHGTWATDRPPVCGVVGRQSGWLALRVGRRNWAAELVHQTVVPRTVPGATAYTDEWAGYRPLRGEGRGHATVNHARGEYARDDDGDGVREVHCNTLEGLWTGLRNFLRPFRGVSKHYLAQYVAMFEWSYNIGRVTDDFLRILIGCPRATAAAT